MRSLLFKTRMECDECGANVFVDGPLPSVRCTDCAATLQIQQDTWKYLIGSYIDDYDSLAAGPRSGVLTSQGRTLVYHVAHGIPSCISCGASFDPAALLSDTDGRVFCGNCGQATTSYAIPDWLKPGLERLVGLVGVSVDDGPDAPLPPLKPVVMSCLNCGAKLEINGDALRIVECKFCNTDHYVPDDIWRRMHPVRRRRPWYALF
jgi:DNA-directed RNA polymerase subunit RPC12/RpoP